MLLLVVLISVREHIIIFDCGLRHLMTIDTVFCDKCFRSRALCGALMLIVDYLYRYIGFICLLQSVRIGNSNIGIHLEQPFPLS